MAAEGGNGGADSADELDHDCAARPPDGPVPTLPARRGPLDPARLGIDMLRHIMSLGSLGPFKSNAVEAVPNLQPVSVPVPEPLPEHESIELPLPLQRRSPCPRSSPPPRWMPSLRHRPLSEHSGMTPMEKLTRCST